MAIRGGPGYALEAEQVAQRAPRPCWGVRLACGHEGTTRGEPSVGGYLSCWSVVGPDRPRCQTPRKVVETWQLALFG